MAKTQFIFQQQTLNLSVTTLQFRKPIKTYKVTRSKNNIKFYIPKLFLFRITKQPKFSVVAIHRHCWQPRNSPCCSCKKSKKKTGASYLVQQEANFLLSSSCSDGEAHFCYLLSEATHAARSNPAFCLALFLSSSTLLTASIFYLDQAETRKKLHLKLFLVQNLIHSKVYPQPQASFKSAAHQIALVHSLKK